MTLEEAARLREEAYQLYMNLHHRFMSQTLPIVRSNPFDEMPPDFEQLDRLQTNARLRLERRIKKQAVIRMEKQR